MSIKQLNASYLLQEDRILFRINTEDKEEFNFALTRRVTLFILAASEHLVEKQLEQQHDPVTAKAVNLPESTCCFDEATLPKKTGTCPPITSLRAGPPPL